MTSVRTINVDLTSDEVKYILHALKEFKATCATKIAEDEDGDDDLTYMYANDVMQTRLIYEKLSKLATPVFGETALVLSYELL